MGRMLRIDFSDELLALEVGKTLACADEEFLRELVVALGKLGLLELGEVDLVSVVVALFLLL